MGVTLSEVLGACILIVQVCLLLITSTYYRKRLRIEEEKLGLLNHESKGERKK